MHEATIVAGFRRSRFADRLMAEKYRLDRVLILPIYRLLMKLRDKPTDKRSGAYLAITATSPAASLRLAS